MKDQSKKLTQKTFEDLLKCIFSAESLAGPMPSKSQSGQVTGKSGQPLAPVHRSAWRANDSPVQVAKAKILCGALDELATQYAQTAKARGLPTPATYGQRSGGLQPSADLNQSLVSKLLVRKGLSGSLEYVVRWKSWATLSGLPIYRLRASTPRTSGKGFSRIKST